MGGILIVDDEKDIRNLISDILSDEGFIVRSAAESDTALSLINDEAPDLIILDIWLKNSKLDGIDILKTVRRDNPDIPIVIISGHGNIEIAVAAIKQGAYDFIEKPFNIDQLMVVISRAMEASRLRRENAQLKVTNVTSTTMIGNSIEFKAMISHLDKVSLSNARVMLTGPSGAGKEVAARYIHMNSNRSKGPFISVNSASIESARMEEVLFGRQLEDSYDPGLLEQAHGGILFFDEIADMPLGTQSKILRVLLEQQFTRVGGTDKVRVDIRVLSSTNKDLLKEIANGNFREDLYHRLNVVPVSVPSLEDRRDDIPLIATYFIKELNRDQGLPKRKIESDAITTLQLRSWPGNIRQLRNFIERVLILGSGTGDIVAQEFPIPSVDFKEKMSGVATNFANLSLREARESFEREYLMVQINRFGGNISKTAIFVGMERSALHRKLKNLKVITSNRTGSRVAEMEEMNTGTDG